MRVYSCDSYVLPLPPGHRFPMARYSLLRQRVERLPGVQVLQPPAATRAQLERVHTPEYVERVFTGGLDKMQLRRLGLPWSPELVERSRRSVGATLSAAEHVMEHGGIAANLAGGTHHAFADRGEGFCVFNDCVVAAEHIGVRSAFVDCDVHQGDGTASLCRGRKDRFTLSLHGRNNYPFHKQISNLDLELPDGCQDDEYLRVLATGLEEVLMFKPQLVFYLAGADPYRGDRLGKLNLTQSGLACRDQLVYQLLGHLPLVITMAGGYAEPIEDTADIQARTVRLAASWLDQQL